jgi:hypothetical protein
MLLRSNTRLGHSPPDDRGAGLARTFTATTLRAMGTSIGSSTGIPGRGSCTCGDAQACKPRSHARSAIRAAMPAPMVTASGLAGKEAGRLRRVVETPQPTQRRALRNMRIQGESSTDRSGAQDICTVRKTRSGWGMTTLKRPSGVVSPVMPAGEPLGL